MGLFCPHSYRIGKRRWQKKWPTVQVEVYQTKIQITSWCIRLCGVLKLFPAVDSVHEMPHLNLETATVTMTTWLKVELVCRPGACASVDLLFNSCSRVHRDVSTTSTELYMFCIECLNSVCFWPWSFRPMIASELR